ncbi:flavoprotein-like protein [Mycena rebaudengoi]|nr:flavoprotein-like protein [Mycena rebaudengoi]
MCFPSKKQKDNFNDGEAAAKTKPKAAAAAAKSSPKGTEKDSASAQSTLTGDVKKGAKVAIVYYSMYGHIRTMAEAVKKGIEEAGGIADLYQVPETLPKEVLDKMYAPAKSDHPEITPAILATYDAFIMGVPTRYGNFPAQWKTFWDSTSSLWASGALAGKYAGAFTSTAGPGGGQESTILATISTLTHHGVLYVPLGYAHAFGQLTNLAEVHGGSPWGAGTFAAPDGSRQPTPLELEIAQIQGKAFWGGG